jgi:hypothetical protein
MKSRCGAPTLIALKRRAQRAVFPRGATRLYTRTIPVPPELTGWLAPTLTPDITLTFAPKTCAAVFGLDWTPTRVGPPHRPLARSVVVGRETPPRLRARPDRRARGLWDVVALVGYAFAHHAHAGRRATVMRAGRCCGAAGGTGALLHCGRSQHHPHAG